MIVSSTHQFVVFLTTLAKYVLHLTSEFNEDVSRKFGSNRLLVAIKEAKMKQIYFSGVNTGLPE